MDYISLELVTSLSSSPPVSNSSPNQDTSPEDLCSDWWRDITSPNFDWDQCSCDGHNYFKACPYQVKLYMILTKTSLLTNTFLVWVTASKSSRSPAPLRKATFVSKTLVCLKINYKFKYAWERRPCYEKHIFKSILLKFVLVLLNIW